MCDVKTSFVLFPPPPPNRRGEGIEGYSDYIVIRVPALTTFSVLFIHKNPFPSANLYGTRVMFNTIRARPVAAVGKTH